jgi:hypothetical protein
VKIPLDLLAWDGITQSTVVVALDAEALKTCPRFLPMTDIGLWESAFG